MWHTVNVRRCDSLRCCYIFIVATHLIRPEQNKKICNYFLRLAKGVFFQNHFPFRSFFCGVYVSRCSIHHLIRVWVASLIHLIKSRVREEKNALFLSEMKPFRLGTEKKVRQKWSEKQIKCLIEKIVSNFSFHFFFFTYFSISIERCAHKNPTPRES